MDTIATPLKLVGRDEELAQIETFLDRACVARASLVLEGPPGIGKSSIWEEAVARARARGVRVLDARPAEPERELPFAGLSDLLATTHDAIGGLPNLQRRGLRAALLLTDSRSGSPDIRVVGMALLGLLRRLADDQPVLIAVDDAQWLDPSSSVVVEFALRRIGEERVSDVLARRPDEDDLRIRTAMVRTVRPLRADAVEVLVANVSEGRLERPLIRRIAEAAGGNPLFALEITRVLVEGGGEAAPSEPLPVPDDVRQLIATRIAALPHAEQDLLLRLAASSRASAERIQEAAVDAKHALLAGILRTEGRVLRFAHPLYAAAVYSAASPTRRRQVHAELAELIDDPEEHARHLALAADGPDAGVAAALDLAAATAEARGAAQAAAELTEQALDATPSDDCDAKMHRALTAGRRHFDAGSSHRSRIVLEQALGEARTPTERARVLRELGLVRGEAEGAHVAVELYAEALEEAVDDEVLRGVLEQTLAWNLRLSKGPAAGLGHAKVAIEIAERTRDPALLATALATRYGLEFAAGLAPAPDLIERALDAERRAGRLFFDESPSAIYAINLVLAEDRFEEARPFLEELRRRFEATGETAVINVWYALASLEWRSGSWRRAIEIANDGLELLGQTGRNTYETNFLGVRAWARAHLGELELARADAERALAHAEAAPRSAASHLGALAFADVSTGNFERAASACEAALSELRETGRSRPTPISFLYVEALVGLGRLEEAEAVLRATTMAPPIRRTVALAALRTKAIVAAARGDLSAAATAVNEGLEYEASAPHRFERARLLLVAGTLHRRERHKGAAAEALSHALEIFEELGATVWADNARAELARLGGRPAHAGRLSETEQRVADLVAEGRSNAEVARALFVSPKTVEWNLSKVYKKLHVSSRTELAAKLAKR